MLRSGVFLAAPSLLLGGCATLPAPSTDGWAAFGNAARTGPVVVVPENLVEDSRCPINARCIWAGRVVIRAKVSLDRQAQAVQLTMGEPVPFAGGLLVLDSVEPGRTTQQGEIPAKDYRFHFSFR